MAIIPDAPSLGQRSTPRPSRNIASYDASIGAKGIQQAGESVSKAGLYAIKTSVDMQEAQDKFEAAQAALMLKEYHINKMNEYRQRPGDYAKFSEDYRAGYEKVFGEAKGLIKNQGRHQAFDLAAKEIYLSGSNDIGALGRSFQSDSYVAFGMQKAESIKAGLISNPTPENWRSSRKMLEAYYDSGAATGVMDADAAERTKRAEINDAGRTFLESLPVREQMKAVMGGQPLSVRNNNPGNLRGADGNFRKFSSPDEGLQAMRADLTAKLSGNSSAMKRNFGDDYTPTIRTIISTYAPKSENDTEAYIATVAKESGLSPDQPLTPADVDKIMRPMIKVEGGSASMAYYSDLPPDVVMAARGRLEAAAPQMVSEQLANAEAMAERGEAFEPIDKQLLDMAEIRSPGITAESELRLRKAKATYEMLGYSPAGMNDLLKKFEPDKANTAGYAEQSKALEALQQAAIAARKKQETATAEAALASSPDIKSIANKAAESNSKAVRALATSIETQQPLDHDYQKNASLDMQAYLGAVKKYADSVGVRQPMLLTDAMADNYADALTAQYKNREARFAALSQIKNASGDYFPDIVQQIASKIFAKGDSDASAKTKKGANALLIASIFLDMSTPNGHAIAATVINNFDVDDREIFDGIASGSNYAAKEGDLTVEKIRNSDFYQKQMEDYNSTISAADPSNAAILDSFNSQIIRAGAIYAKRGGMGIDEGMKLAIAQARSGYVFATQGGKIYDGSNSPPIAIPLAYADKAAQVQIFADKMVDYIALSRELKVDYVQGDGLPREYEDVAATVRHNAFWASDKNGLKLVVPTATGSVSVLDAKTNEPITRTWDDFIIGKRSLEQIKKIADPAIRANYALDLALSYPAGKAPKDVIDMLTQARQEELAFKEKQRNQIIKEQVYKRRLYNEKVGK